MLDNTPWIVGGGAEISNETARLLAYAATNGAEGVAGIDDFKVQAQAVPNGSVAVLPGGAILLNRYPGGSQQSYVMRGGTQTDVAITATGSGGGRTDLIVARILDPQYEGPTPADPINFQYARLEVIQGVPAGIKRARELNLTYPAVEVAKVALPANTATVTAGMITDLRKVARPRRDRQLDTAFWTVAINADSAAYKVLGGSTSFDVPDWASAAKVKLTFSGVAVIGGNTTGWLRGMFNGQEVRPTFFDVDGGAGSIQRTTYEVAGEILIPANMRGGSYTMSLEAKRDSGPGYLQPRSGTSVSIDIEFAEKAY